MVATNEAVKARLIKRARIDDNEDAIEKRFAEYEKSTMPLIRWLNTNGVKVYDINAEQPVENVNQKIISTLKENNIN